MSFATGSPPYKEALEIQRILLSSLRIEETPAAVKAQLARAWKELEGMKRIIRGLPANTSQSIKSEPKQRKSRVSGPVEPVEVVEPMRVSGPVHPTDTQPSGTTDARAQVKPSVSQPDCQPVKSTGAWAKAMGQDDPSEQV